MTIRTKFFVLSIFLQLWFIHHHVIDAAVNCSVYSNELDVININPFFVRLNFSANLTSVEYDSKLKQIKKLVIFNNMNASDSVFCLKNLESLQLIKTNLPLLPDINNLKNLNFLQIESASTSTEYIIPSTIGQLTSLFSLILKSINNLTSLPDDIGQLKQLQSLTLAQLPNLQTIPIIAMANLTQLRTLNLLDIPKLVNLPSPMQNFQQLNLFNLSNTNLSSLELQNLQELTTFLISSNLAMISIHIEYMIKLSSLEIFGNNALQTLVLQNLISLKSLLLTSNSKLTSIFLQNCTALESLSIKNAPSLKEIVIKNFNALSTFNLTSNNLLQSIVLENVPQLRFANLGGNQNLSAIIFTYAPRIKQLDLSSCQMTTFPETILTLKSLEILNMQGNQLSTLPETISIDLPNLRTLNLASNQFKNNIIQPPLIYIRELDMSSNSLTTLYNIEEYKHLERLVLYQNQIQSIPMEIMKLSAVLQSFSIGSNQLTSIPYSMTNMRSLQNISAGGNRIDFPECDRLIKLFTPTTIKVFIC